MCRRTILYRLENRLYAEFVVRMSPVASEKKSIDRDAFKNAKNLARIKSLEFCK